MAKRAARSEAAPPAFPTFREMLHEMALALEHDGEVYSCDHFVYPEYRLGNLLRDRGRGEEAMNCLERACALGLRQKGWYEHDSNLDSVRGEPRFQELLRGLDAG